MYFDTIGSFAAFLLGQVGESGALEISENWLEHLEAAFQEKAISWSDFSLLKFDEQTFRTFHRVVYDILAESVENIGEAGDVELYYTELQMSYDLLLRFYGVARIVGLQIEHWEIILPLIIEDQDIAQCAVQMIETIEHIISHDYQVIKGRPLRPEDIAGLIGKC